MRRRRVIAALALAVSLGVGGMTVPVPALAATPGSTPGTATSLGYPFASGNPGQVDPWGAEVRQCTSFASWWLTRHGVKISGRTGIRGPRGPALLGNASHWDAAARRAGFAVSATPVLGAIAQWRAGEQSTWAIPGGYTYLKAGPDGHVGVVRKVYGDGTALIQDYNGAVPLGGHTYRGRAPRYLLIHA